MKGMLNVVRFEIMRNVKKPSFWIAAVLVPILLVGYVLIAGLAGYTAGDSLTAGTDTSEMKLAIDDESKYLKVFEFQNQNEEMQTLAQYDNKEQGIKDIKAKKIDVFYYIPADFADNSNIEVYVKPDQAKVLDDYTSPIKTLLMAQAISEIPAVNYKIITGAVDIQTTTFDAKDDHEVDFSETVNKVVAPLMGLVLFYILICVLGNRIITAMTEEKENRISELLLTSIKPTDLIIGKIISLMVLGIIQLLVQAIPVIVIINTPAINNVLPEGFELNVDAFEIAKYGLYLIAAYFLYTAICVAIGSVSPTAKDASSYSGVLVILMIVLPFMFMGSFSGEPQAMTYFLTFFPPSAPLTVMFRALFSTLQDWEFWVSFAELIIIGAVATVIATKLFRRNVISFTSKVSFKKLFGRPRTSWKN